MIYCLIGASSSGKTTIEERVVSIFDSNVKKIVSYTTRPKRKAEKDGFHYHFISNNTFFDMEKRGLFAETAKYRDWYYGISLNGIDYKNNDYIVVVTVSGYKELLKKVGKENIIAIHVKVEERNRLIRQLNRGDDIDEVIRRLYADREDFKEVEEVCDYIIENYNLNKAVKSVIEIIKVHSIYKNKGKVPNKIV